MTKIVVDKVPDQAKDCCFAKRLNNGTYFCNINNGKCTLQRRILPECNFLTDQTASKKQEI